MMGSIYELFTLKNKTTMFLSTVLTLKNKTAMFLSTVLSIFFVDNVATKHGILTKAGWQNKEVGCCKHYRVTYRRLFSRS